MITFACSHDKRHKHGKNACGNQRYKCACCGVAFGEETSGPFGNMRVETETAIRAIRLMLEGMSIRSVQRMTGLCRRTLADLVVLVGENCQRLLDSTIKGVEVKDVEIDEIWSFVGMKEKQRVAKNESLKFGDSWTFIAIERTSKLVLAHYVGDRESNTCWAFLCKLKQAIGQNRFQLTSDGHKMYTSNVPFAFGLQAQFAQLIKQYASTQEETRYSPARIIGIKRLPIMGAPEQDRISTSMIQRFNLTLRMGLRRFTRLTNGHSKSLKHHVAMQAIVVAFHNFARKHETLKGNTPAMASGLADHVWSVEELLTRAAKC